MKATRTKDDGAFGAPEEDLAGVTAAVKSEFFKGQLKHDNF